MERSVTNAKEMLRESVTRFLANADGREVIINVTARLVKKLNIEGKEMKEDINIEQPERHHGKNTDNSSPSQVRLSSSVASQEISSDISSFCHEDSELQTNKHSSISKIVGSSDVSYRI